VVPTGFALPLDTPDSHLVTDGYPFPPSAPPDELEDEELDEGVDGSDGVEAAAGSAAGSLVVGNNFYYFHFVLL